MTQEERQLLLKDLCGKLPYGVMVSVQGGEFDSYKNPYHLTAVSKFGLESLCKVYHPIYTPFGTPNIEDVKPYLRPMSNMTEDERVELRKYCEEQSIIEYNIGVVGAHSPSIIDFLNAHHFDYRGLIKKGLALEAPEGMYK